MPKFRRPPPPGILNHLLEKFRDGRIAATDFIGLKHWLEGAPEVPDGPWFKRFPNFTPVGDGELLKTFLTRSMVPKGREVE